MPLGGSRPYANEKKDLIEVNDRVFLGLFEEPGLVDGVGGSCFNFQLVIAGGKVLQVVEWDAVDPGFEAGTQHSDYFSVLEIGQQDDAVKSFFARYLQHQIMFKRIRVHRNFNCHNHSLWDLGISVRDFAIVSGRRCVLALNAALVALSRVNLGNDTYRDQSGHRFLLESQIGKGCVNYACECFHCARFSYYRPICGQIVTVLKMN